MTKMSCLIGIWLRELGGNTDDSSLDRYICVRRSYKPDFSWGYVGKTRNKTGRAVNPVSTSLANYATPYIFLNNCVFVD